MPRFISFNDCSDGDERTDSSRVSPDLRNDKEDKEIYYEPGQRGFGEFFVYASCFWLDHFKVSAPELLPHVSGVVKLCDTSSKRLKNWIGQNCRPECTITPKFDYDSCSQDPLTVTSLHGSEFALRKLLEDDNINIESKEFLRDSIRSTIKQIIQWGDISRLSILFRDPLIGPKVRNIGIFHLIMTQWTSSDKKSRPWAGCFDLVFDICDAVLVR